MARIDPNRFDFKSASYSGGSKPLFRDDQYQGQMSWSPYLDTNRYTYPCGHFVVVPTSKITASGGHTAPPVCVTCNGKELTERMKYKKWNVGQYFVPLEGIKNGAMVWLDAELTRVRQKAWA